MSVVGQSVVTGGRRNVAVIGAGRLVVPIRVNVQRSLSPYRAVEKDM